MDRSVTRIRLGLERASWWTCLLLMFPVSMSHISPDRHIPAVSDSRWTFVGSLRDLSSVRRPPTPCPHPTFRVRKRKQFTEHYCFSDPAASSLLGLADPQRLAVTFPLPDRLSLNIHNTTNTCETAYGSGTLTRPQIACTDSVSPTWKNDPCVHFLWKFLSLTLWGCCVLIQRS